MTEQNKALRANSQQFPLRMLSLAVKRTSFAPFWDLHQTNFWTKLLRVNIKFCILHKRPIWFKKKKTKNKQTNPTS